MRAVRLIRRVGAFAGIGVAIALTAWPCVAPAQVESPGSIGPAVVALCKEALAHAKKGEFEAARKLYAKALETSPSAAILFNLALAELNSGHALDSLRHFREYMRATDTEAPKVAIVSTELLPKALAATGHIQINGTPTGATAYLDGEEIVSAPGGVVDVMPGQHSVGAYTPDRGWRADVTVAAGATAEARFTLVWVHSGLSGSRADGGP
jgi:tetratricopeptide (TPR) repeat protein